MLSLKFMFVLVFILLSINDTTIAHTTTATTHEQVEQHTGVDEAGNGITNLGEKEDNKMSKEDYKNSVATKWEGKTRKLQGKLSNVKVNRASLMEFSDADYSMPVTHPPRNN
ncbi:hypothetical protein P3S67_009689 [Capsicum chacoense]